MTVFSIMKTEYIKAKFVVFITKNTAYTTKNLMRLLLIREYYSPLNFKMIFDEYTFC